VTSCASGLTASRKKSVGLPPRKTVAYIRLYRLCRISMLIAYLITEKFMKTIKSLLLGLLVLAGTLGASSAFAQWTVGGSSSGTSIIGAGPTNLSYLGASFPCTSTFTVVDTAGSAKVTAASFTGSAVCTSIKANNLPWQISAPVGNGPWTGTVMGVNVTAAGVFNCSGNASISVTKPGGAVTLSGSLGVCAISSGSLPSSPVVQG